jgi:type IV secretion system protein TrbI
MSNEPMTADTNAEGRGAEATTRRPQGVRRLNRLPIFLGGGALTALLLLMTVAIVNRTSLRSGTGADDDKARHSATDSASALINGQPDGVITAQPPDLGTNFNETVPPSRAARAPTPERAGKPPLDGPEDDRALRMATRIAEYEDERALENRRLRDRMETDALNANTSLALAGLDRKGGSSFAGPDAEDVQPVAATTMALPGLAASVQARSAAQVGVAVAGAQPMTAGEALAAIKSNGVTVTDDPNGQGKKAAFLESAGALDTTDYLERVVQEPLSPYELKQGSVIPGILVTGINSDLPGRIIGQVSRNVYDSATGQYLLIPQGTKIFGRYDSDVSFGQQRVLVAWTRLVFPNGSAINIEGMAGTDQAGAGGFNDRVNNHWGRTIKSALLISVMGAGIENLTASKNSDDVAEAIRSSFGDTFSAVAKKSVERNLAVQPTLEIRPGYRFLIVVDKDMILKPYG